MGGQRLRDQTDPVPGILGEVKCLQLELDTERSRAEQARTETQQAMLSPLN